MVEEIPCIFSALGDLEISDLKARDWTRQPLVFLEFMVYRGFKETSEPALSSHSSLAEDNDGGDSQETSPNSAP